LEGIAFVSSELDQGELREKAKKRLDGKGIIQERSAEDNIKLVEELSLHQEELNIQNEELNRIQVELEATKAEYFELYDMAPVGYITITSELMIKDSNLAASKILGMDRSNIINKGLSSFISPSCQESLYLHYQRLSSGNEKQIHIFQVRGQEGDDHQVQFESNYVDEASGKGFRSILTDVTELKKAEAALQESE
jgi:PAS domain S-box-containing protein